MTTEQFAELLTELKAIKLVLKEGRDLLESGRLDELISKPLQAFEAAKRISPEWAGTVDPYIDEIRDKGGTF